MGNNVANRCHQLSTTADPPDPPGPTIFAKLWIRMPFVICNVETTLILCSCFKIYVKLAIIEFAQILIRTHITTKIFWLILSIVFVIMHYIFSLVG